MDPNGYIDLCVIAIEMQLSNFPIAFFQPTPDHWFQFDYVQLYGVQESHVLNIVLAMGFPHLEPPFTSIV